MNDADFYIGKPIRSLQTMLRVIAAADEAIPQVVPDGIYGLGIRAVDAVRHDLRDGFICRRQARPIRRRGTGSWTHI